MAAASASAGRGGQRPVRCPALPLAPRDRTMARRKRPERTHRRKPAVPGATERCGPVDSASRLLGMLGPSPPTLLPARSPEPPPSACPPLTAPVAPFASPEFVTDRLRTTFAPRIGEPDQRACRAYRGASRSAYAPLFPSATIAAARVNRGGRGHTLALHNGLGTYNHLLGSRHGAFASKPARSSRSRLPRHLIGHDHAHHGLLGDWTVTPRIVAHFRHSGRIIRIAGTSEAQYRPGHPGKYAPERMQHGTGRALRLSCRR